jgi:hypothetical protein
MDSLPAHTVDGCKTGVKDALLTAPAAIGSLST